MKKKWIKIVGTFMAALMFMFGSSLSMLTVYAFGGEKTVVADASAAETEKESKPEEKEKQVLTPDGNMDLVDDIDGETEMQFLTVTTKDGHYFYIVIERNKDSENVHFLNQVDVRDLLNIMSEEEVKEFQESNKDESETETPVIIPEPETKPTPETQPETDETPPTPVKEKSNPFKMLGLFLLIGGAIAGGYYFIKIKPSKGSGGYDDDLDFDDDAEYVEESEEEKEPEFHDEGAEEDTDQ